LDQNDLADTRRAEFARLIEAGVVPQAAGRRVGISRSVAQRWAILFRVGGLEKLSSLNGAPKRYPFALKLQAVRRTFSGVSEFAVQLAGWLHWFNTARISALRDGMSPRACRFATAA
jgi:transposase-like protein